MAFAYYDDETQQQGPQLAQPQSNPDPQQFVKDTGRESFHWHTIPEAYRNIPGIMDWANDPNSDPNEKIQAFLASQRAAGPTDAGDAQALMNYGAPKNASPAQQWNAQPAQPQAGTGHDALFSLLMQRAQQGTAVDRNDPNIRAQVDPFVAQSERAKRNYLGNVAEREGPYGNIRGEERMANERFGQQAGMFEGEVIGREIAARRDEIAQSLQLWGSMMSAEQRMGLERELAQLNDRARTADRGQNMDQFLRELALREWMAGEDNDYRWAGLGG